MTLLLIEEGDLKALCKRGYDGVIVDRVEGSSPLMMVLDQTSKWNCDWDVVAVLPEELVQ